MRESAGSQNKICCAKETDANERRSGDTLQVRSESDFGRITHLQRSLGNQVIQRLFRSGVIQAKLKIGEPNDVYEQEADRMAEQVLRMPKTSAVSGQQSAFSKTNESVQKKPG